MKKKKKIKHKPTQNFNLKGLEIIVKRYKQKHLKKNLS